MDAVRDLDPSLHKQHGLDKAANVAEPAPKFTHDGYLGSVHRADAHIEAGEILQVVPWQRWRQPYAFYRILGRINPSPFVFHLDIGGRQLIGASPEILVRVFDGEVTHPHHRRLPPARHD